MSDSFFYYDYFIHVIKSQVSYYEITDKLFFLRLNYNVISLDYGQFLRF